MSVGRRSSPAGMTGPAGKAEEDWAARQAGQQATDPVGRVSATINPPCCPSPSLGTPPPAQTPDAQQPAQGKAQRCDLPLPRSNGGYGGRSTRWSFPYRRLPGHRFAVSWAAIPRRCGGSLRPSMHWASPILQQHQRFWPWREGVGVEGLAAESERQIPFLRIIQNCSGTSLNWTIYQCGVRIFGLSTLQCIRLGKCRYYIISKYDIL